MEHDYANRDATAIRKTRFGLRPAGSGYEFYVIEQIGNTPAPTDRHG